MYKLKRLKTLCCTSCSKLKSFPEIMEVMENLRELYLDRTGIKSLPWSIEHLKGIQYLDLAHCENLESLPESICNLRSLKILHIHNCSKLYKFPCMLRSSMDNISWNSPFGSSDFDLLLAISNDIGLSASFYHESPETNLKNGNLEPEFLQRGSPQPESPSKRSYWEDDQMMEVIMTDDCGLYWLEELDLSHCNLEDGGITSEVFHLPSLQVLNLSGNNFWKIPPNISNLSKLRILKMSHCKLLLEIPELPSSIREIDAHGCPNLLPLQRQTQLFHSLLNCLKSDIQVQFLLHI